MYITFIKTKQVLNSNRLIAYKNGICNEEITEKCNSHGMLLCGRSQIPNNSQRFNWYEYGFPRAFVLLIRDNKRKTVKIRRC